MTHDSITFPDFIPEEGGVVTPEIHDLDLFLSEQGIVNFSASEIARVMIPPLWLWSRIIPTLQVLERCRAEIRKSYPHAHISVSSGYRDPEHNARIGGSKGSRHMYFEAIDFSPMRDSRTPFGHKTFTAILKADPLFPFMWWKDYKTFYHMDSRALFNVDPRGANFR